MTFPLWAMLLTAFLAGFLVGAAVMAQMWDNSLK